MSTNPSAPPTFNLAPWQRIAVYSPFKHTGMFGGIGSGKSFSLAHFSIRMFCENPDLTGFIGANSYDQLTQATLRELFYWLEHHDFEYCIDRMPPVSWGLNPKKFKKWTNILTVWNPRNQKASIAFTRVLSDPDALRGIEFSWYAIDETRDTPHYTHDVLLGRMRESDVALGLVATTTNGEDWAYERFVKGNDGTGLYGSLHVSTLEAVKVGILTQTYFDSLLKSYSPMMAEQELFARHVNVYGGRAYYAAKNQNKQRVSPWGDSVPDPERPLIIGCDFNFSPAPCIWMVGQTGPNLIGPDGIPFWEKIHWFGEIVMNEASSSDMALRLASQYPHFHYRIFGDASGTRGTTSNAGVNDYQQIGITLADIGASYQIDWVHGNPDESRANPRVKNRVEHMNSYLCNAAGEVRMTYNPDKCPHFDGDMRNVGWKKQTGNMSGMGKLDDGGDVKRTHASDGGGYALYKVFPPRRQARVIGSNASPLLAEINM